MFISLHGSYADVYRGHGTDFALLAGLLGYAPDSEKMVEAEHEAREKGLTYEFILSDLGPDYHPNTVKFELQKGAQRFVLIGSSIGAGSVEIVEIENIKTSNLHGKRETLIVMQGDVPGVIATIAQRIASEQINIAEMYVARDRRGGRALTIVTLDDVLKNGIVDEINKSKGVHWVKLLPKLK